jgi:quercetin dioxygenase-like cupin family protein
VNRKMLGLILVCALATPALVAAAPSLGTGKPIVAKTVAAGKMQATTIHAGTGSMILESFRISPGGTFGWHRHGAPVAVLVTRGTLTAFDPTVNGCAPFKVTKGQSFVEPANHVHLVRNDGRTAATVYALYLGVRNPNAANVEAKQPPGCDA